MSSPPPFRTLARADLDPATTYRLWQGVTARRKVRARVRRSLALVTTFAVGIAVAMLFVRFVAKSPSNPALALNVREVGSLKLRGGGVWSDSVATQNEPRAFEL